MTDSKTPTSPLVRSLRTDLRYQWASLHLLHSLAALTAVAAVFAVGAWLSARSAVTALAEEFAYLRREGGYTFDRAIGGGDPADAPLRATWEFASATVANLHPVQGAVSLLQVLTFVVGPLVFFTYGVIAATRDRRHGTLRLRTVREGPRRLFASMAGALAVTVTAVGVAACAVTLVISTALSLAADGGIDTSALAVPEDLSVTAPLPVLAALIGSGLFFALLGMSVALVVGRPLIVIPAFLAAFFLVPVLGPFDPRNLLMVLAHPHMEFVGGFAPSPPLAVSPPLAAALLALGTAAAAALAHTVHSRRSAHTG
ncbi:hypothetical protein ACN20G_30785 (plasmid) [Streptomyces sp. BI20]|uniref:hypothetical protein n=1 Tax=Streptomyces sp. BI20 TaxID=3403460 RepID=UPI003C760199